MDKKDNNITSLYNIRNLKKHFSYGKNVNKAVDGVNLDIYLGETLGLVGESGCGKSTMGRLILGLYNLTDGEIVFQGEDINKMNKKDLFNYAKKTQMIFQDPYASLNPRMIVENIIGEGIDIHKIYNGKEKKDRVHKLLETVGLSKEHANRFPHEFSGGQRQRISIARALAVEPEFIVCDEPISALDVSIQAQIVNLLIELQEKFNLTYLFIAHDLSMVKYISKRIAVMYLGLIAELADSETIYDNPLHPYTNLLLSSIPIPDPEIERKKEKKLIKGDIFSSNRPLNGCPFYPRCPKAVDKCKNEIPKLIEVEKGHFVACLLY
ncbi:MAG: oligopeptide/dipeptide ABC transporter ATP-binding protein [Clostridiales bacterium]